MINITSRHYGECRERLAFHLGCTTKQVRAKIAESLVKQVLGMLFSWLERSKARVHQLLRRISYELQGAGSEFLKKLGLPQVTMEDVTGAIRINSFGLWDLDPEQIRQKMATSKRAAEFTSPTDLSIRLSASLWELVGRQRGPKYGEIHVQLGGHVRVGPALTSKHFPLWVTIPAIGRKPLSLPLVLKQSKAKSQKGSTLKRCLRSMEGPHSAFVELRRGEGNKLEVRLIRNLTASAKQWRDAYVPRTEKVGLDFGLRRALVDHQGNHFGTWHAHLKRHDRRITRLRSRLQAQGIFASSRLERMRKSKQGFIQTTLGTALHKIVLHHRPATVVVENLDFRGGGLSRAYNRILGDCGRYFFKRKLADLQDRLGILISEVNPAYTSLMCSACGFPDAANRRGDFFRCKACGFSLHADVNAARNILMRHQDLELSRVRHHSQILELLARRWLKRVLQKSTGPPVRAREALRRSSYLRRKMPALQLTQWGS